MEVKLKMYREEVKEREGKGRGEKTWGREESASVSAGTLG